jgi:hypothetical protein
MMGEHEQDRREDEPSLAWYGHPPPSEAELTPDTGEREVAPAEKPDIYDRVVMSALLVGGALLLARSRTFRLVTWRLARVALTTWLPARIATEVRRAWHDAAADDRPEADAARSG